MRLDKEAGAVPRGGQLMISYGARSNDLLLQYYGFVQAGNPHEVFAYEPDALVLALGYVYEPPAGQCGAASFVDVPPVESHGGDFVLKFIRVRAGLVF